MTLIQHLADIIGAGLLGAFLVAAFCLSAADRRGYNRAVEENRIVEGAKLARAVEDPPSDGPQIPTGAEPALGQVRVGVTGRSDAPRTSGNAAPTTGEEAPPQTGAPAGSKRGGYYEGRHRHTLGSTAQQDRDTTTRQRETHERWPMFARWERERLIKTPTQEFTALVGASWTPEETAALELSEVTG